tara:strand:- start:3608 stop:4795 length:1188 start_codon:yes stop_codon:yes gene_type:complete
MSQLTDIKVEKAKKGDKTKILTDGNGLQLRINVSGSKKWLFAYRRPADNKRTSITLGNYPALSLAKARKKTLENLELLQDEIDPKQQREEKEQAKKAIVTHKFINVAKDWFEVKKTEVSADYGEDVWRSLELHIFPQLGEKITSDILAPEVIAILKPLEAKGSRETVKRVNQRLNEIMVFAVNTGVIEHNRLSGIKAAFQKPVSKNQPAIHPKELPKFFNDLDYTAIKPVTRLLIEFQMHTMTRPAEAAKAKWSELDLEKKQWVIPAERMKMEREHIVPLTTQSMAIIDRLKKISGHRPYLFPADRNPLRHANESTANAAITRAGYKDKLVAHGMRSIASTALNEHEFNHDVIEACLAHKDPNEVRAAYNRAEYLEQRRKLLQWWSDYIEAAKNG